MYTYIEYNSGIQCESERAAIIVHARGLSPSGEILPPTIPVFTSATALPLASALITPVAGGSALRWIEDKGGRWKGKNPGDFGFAIRAYKR